MSTLPERTEITFGTFDQRLDHICAVLNVEPPQLEFDEAGDGRCPLLTDELWRWLESNEVNLDWFFCGHADGLIRSYAKRKTGLGYIIEQVHKLPKSELEPLLAVLKQNLRERGAMQ